MHKWLKVSIFPTAHDLDLERSFFAYLYDMAVIKARTKVLLVSQKRFQDKYLYFWRFCACPFARVFLVDVESCDCLFSLQAGSEQHEVWAQHLLDSPSSRCSLQEL